MDRDEAVRKPHRKTCKRYNTAGHAHAINFSCFGQRPFLARPRTCEWMIEAIESARRVHRFDLWAFVIMPEHVHLVILPTEPDYSVSSILTTLKRSVARKAIAFVRSETPEFLPTMTVTSAKNRKTVRFWQRGGGYDRNLWSPRYIWQMIDYIHDNPVRRKLSAARVDWPWSSAATYEDETKEPLQIDFASLPHDPR